MALRKAPKALLLSAAALAVLGLLSFPNLSKVAARQAPAAHVRPLTNRKFEPSPERMARGKYLVESVAGCFGCHAKMANNLGPGELPEFTDVGAGNVFVDEKDFVLVASNITPDVETGAGSWTDDQLARAIREGIGHDGRVLFPMMPYTVYKDMSDEDLASIIIYIRSIPAVHKEQPKTKIPARYADAILKFPEPIEHEIGPPANDPVSRGRYLVAVAHCHECHTPFDDKTVDFVPGMDFAGGADFGDVASANITPDYTGIGYFDEALFIKTLRTGWVGARPLRMPMPWPFFRNMTDDDLKAIYAYLRTLPPIHHDVDNTEVATFCKRCNGKHGLGEHNDRYALPESKKFEEQAKK